MTGSTVDERHLLALVASAGRHVAGLPGAKRVVARLKDARSPEDLGYILQSLDLGMEEPAREVVTQAATDRERWEEVHATLLRSAEQHLTERFHSSA